VRLHGRDGARHIRDAAVDFAAAGEAPHALAFGIEINTCTRCGGKLKVIASIEEPEVIAKILAHLQKAGPDPQQAELPLGARAPPTQALLI
jgi:hypothetical protein